MWDSAIAWRAHSTEFALNLFLHIFEQFLQSLKSWVGGWGGGGNADQLGVFASFLSDVNVCV